MRPCHKIPAKLTQWKRRVSIVREPNGKGNPYRPFYLLSTSREISESEVK